MSRRDGDKKLRRTNGQRAVILSAAFAAVLSLASAAALGGGQYMLQRRQLVDIKDREEQLADIGTTTSPSTSAPAVTSPETTPTSHDSSPSPTSVSTAPTFPAADPQAKNFLITGADNNSCIDPDSPFAASVGAREGERSDTIVIWRVDPSTSRAAVLSLPRDLWVSIPDAGQSRINAAYRRNDPSLLISTINANFGIFIDHFIQVDFCAFKTLVNAVGGVQVPFDFPARDKRSGLNVPKPGCFEFDGDHALAYVRSRYYEYLPDGADPDDGWVQDWSSDLGRISRQQDFMRRMLARVVDKGTLNPSIARSLIEATTDYVVTDNELSPQKLLEFAGVLRNVRPDGIPNYQVTASEATISGNAVLLPELDNERMQEVLALFRGEISLRKLPPSKAPRNADDTATTPATTGPAAAERLTPEATPSAPTSTPITATAATTAPPPPDDSAPEDIEFGVLPPAGVICN